MQFQECLSEASGEGRGRLGDSALGSCKLGCETGQEIILGLFRSQDGDRRKNSESVSRQEDNTLGCRASGDWSYDVLNMVDRVGYTGVLGNALVSEIALSVLIQGNVLKQSVSLDRVVDIRFGFLVKVDNLGVASALKVEDAAVIPAVLEKIAVFSPFISVFAEQCMAAMPFSGR